MSRLENNPWIVRIGLTVLGVVWLGYLLMTSPGTEEVDSDADVVCAAVLKVEQGDDRTGSMTLEEFELAMHGCHNRRTMRLALAFPAGIFTAAAVTALALQRVRGELKNAEDGRMYAIERIADLNMRLRALEGNPGPSREDPR